ncbi:MAG TPA: trypsin-like serine protease [Thiotrichaceae bacterium]|nr:trypsin-like serine protease [Thiotrichaceae bacterium]
MANDELKKHIHREIANASVKILEKVEDQYEFRGTGFFITSQGYLLSAYHCIKDAPPEDIFIETRFDGQFQAVVDKEKSLQDTQYDIAVLKVNHSPSHCLPLSTISHQHRSGDEVVGVGYPAGHKPENTQIGTYVGTISRFRTDNKIENDVIKGQGQSGGLIYHYATQRVIGLAVRDYDRDVMSDTGLATRFELLFEKWPELEIINDKVAQAWETGLVKWEEGKLQQIETQLDEARDLERNHAYPQALTKWQAIQALAPDKIQVSQAIQNLEDKMNLKKRVIDVQKRLTKHFKVLGATYVQIDARLRRMKKEGVDDETETLLNILEQFLSQAISAQDLIDFWSSLDQQPTKTSTDALNYQALADRLRRGDIVIFLGNDLLPSLCEHTLSREQMLSRLADSVDYSDFEGDFTSLCEYIDMNNQFGRPSLCEKLQTLVEPKTSRSIALYQLFAQLKKPLLLISATYDTHLEQTFKAHDKKFVVLFHHSEKQNTDTLFLEYSDQTEIQQCSSEHLSRMPLLEKGYSVIYKMLGRVTNSDSPDSYQALVLSEKDYFTFTQYQEKLIPSYVVNRLRNRGFWLLGHHPQSWDKRLIIRTILSKRLNEEPALTVFQQADKFARLYLKNKQIEHYPIDLKVFVENLQAQL